MVVPAQQYPVVSVGLAPVGVGGDVVDFAPRARDGAPGYHAPAITSEDGAPLVSVEYSLRAP